MTIILIFLAVQLFCVIFAYVPIVWIINYTLRPKPRQEEDELRDRYIVRDEIPTAEYIEKIEHQMADKKHLPLR